MIKAIVIGLILSASCFFSEPGESIEGDWKVIEYREEGEKDSAGGGVGKIYRFTNKTISSVSDEQNKETYAYRIEPEMGHLDWKVRIGDLDLVMKSIYAISGDTLTICRAFPGEPRPTSVNDATGKRVGVFTLKRVKH